MKRIIDTFTLFFIISPLLSSCNNSFDSISEDTIKTEKKEFISSFESENDFDGFHITPQNHLGSTHHELTDTNVHSGTYLIRLG